MIRDVRFWLALFAISVFVAACSSERSLIPIRSSAISSQDLGTNSSATEKTRLPNVQRGPDGADDTDDTDDSDDSDDSDSGDSDYGDDSSDSDETDDPDDTDDSDVSDSPSPAPTDSGDPCNDTGPDVCASYPPPTATPTPQPPPPTNPPPPPTPTQSPTGLKKGCNNRDKTAATAIAQAVSQNPGLLNPTGPGSSGQEAYGYIYEDSQGNYYYLPGNNGQPVNLNGNIVSVPDYPDLPGYTHVGWYHTHPNDPMAQGGLQTDVQNGLFFSPTDLNGGLTDATDAAYVGVMTATIDGGPVSSQWFSYSNGKQSSGTPVGRGGC